MLTFSRKGSKNLMQQHRDQRITEAPLKFQYLCVICNLLIQVNSGFRSQVNFAPGPLSFVCDINYLLETQPISIVIGFTCRSSYLDFK